MLVKKCYATRKSNDGTYGHFEISEMNFEIAFINSWGHLESNDRNDFISGSCMDALFDSMKSNMRKIYDTTVHLVDDGITIMKRTHHANENRNRYSHVGMIHNQRMTYNGSHMNPYHNTHAITTPNPFYTIPPLNMIPSFPTQTYFNNYPTTNMKKDLEEDGENELSTVHI